MLEMTSTGEYRMACLHDVTRRYRAIGAAVPPVKMTLVNAASWLIATTLVPRARHVASQCSNTVRPVGVKTRLAHPVGQYGGAIASRLATATSELRGVQIKRVRLGDVR